MNFTTIDHGTRCKTARTFTSIIIKFERKIETATNQPTMEKKRKTPREAVRSESFEKALIFDGIDAADTQAANRNTLIYNILMKKMFRF
jgi:hypothetical protein